MSATPAADAPVAAYVASTSVHLVRTRLPLLRRMRSGGWRVIAVAPPDPSSPALQAAGIEWIAMPIAREIARPVRHGATYAALRALYRDTRPTLVHHLTANPVIYGSLAAWRSRVPAVVNALPGLGAVFASRHWDAPALRAWLRMAYRLATRLPNSRTIFQNRDDYELFVRAGVVPRRRAVLIRGSGIDLDAFRPTPEPAGVPTVLFCGRMLASKGLDDLVAAARLLRQRHMPCTVRLVGRTDPSHRHAVREAQLRQWVAEGLVQWDGPRDDMPAVYAAAHVVVLPSSWEGVPRCLAESAACGRPLVAADAPGCREIVVHERTGLLVPPGDPVRLADAIARLLSSPAERAAFGRAGRALVEAEFAQDAVIDATLDVYRTLLGPALRLPQAGAPGPHPLTGETRCDSPSRSPSAGVRD